MEIEWNNLVLIIVDFMLAGVNLFLLRYVIHEEVIINDYSKWWYAPPIIAIIASFMVAGYFTGKLFRVCD